MGADLIDIIHQEISRAMARSSGIKAATVSSYDPNRHAIKATVQPDGYETGWFPIGTQHIGNGFGIVSGPQIGDQIIVGFLGGDAESPVHLGRIHSDQEQPPKANAGEIILRDTQGSQTKYDSTGVTQTVAGSTIKMGSDGSGTMDFGSNPLKMKGQTSMDGSLSVSGSTTASGPTTLNGLTTVTGPMSANGVDVMAALAIIGLPAGAATKRQTTLALIDPSNPAGANVYAAVVNAIDPLCGDAASAEWVAGSPIAPGDALHTLIQTVTGWTSDQMSAFMGLATNKLVLGIPLNSATKRQIILALVDVTNPSGENLMPTILAAIDPLGADAASAQWLVGDPVAPADPLYVLIETTAGWTDAEMATFFALAKSKPA